MEADYDSPVLIDLDPVERITADAVGTPGSRAFYLQARKGDRLVTLMLEKQQVQLLAASVVEILSRLGKEMGEGPPEEAMHLEEPILPEWRAGRLSIGYEEERDLILLEAEELIPDNDEESEDADDEEEEEEIGGGDEEAGGPILGGLHIGPLWTPEIAEEDVSEEELAEKGAPGLGDVEWDEDPELEGVEGHEPGKVRFWATREQMLSLARHGASVCAQGRPRCQLCGNPIDPEGHQCPALNGHRKSE
jgi:uncharacterized repeat protein (TIGR03847 family)